MAVRREEQTSLIKEYLQKEGKWHDFQEWVSDEGYTIDELGFKK